jgi:HEAT repeat protein
MAASSRIFAAVTHRMRVTGGSRVLALGALGLSLVSATLFTVGVRGDPHEGPFWLTFLALVWPVFLCPLSCVAVVVFLLFERHQSLARRAVTLMVAASAGLLPWLPGIVSLKLWLSPERALRDSSPIVRSRGAEALAKQEGPKVVAALARALKDPDDDVRLNAAVGLWNQGPEATVAVPALLDALDDPIYGVRGWAMGELARIPGTAPRAVPRFVDAMAERTEDRSNAIDALFWYGAAAAPAIPALRDVLSHGQPFERRRAARTLGAIGAEARSCIPELRMQLRDVHEAVRETARASLVALGEKGDLPPSVIDSWPERRFSRRAWQATPYWVNSHTTNENQRYVFYKDLARRHLLEDKPAAEIAALLGPPHTNDRWRLLYHLKSSIASWAGGGPIESENAATWWLEISLDSEGRALAVYLYPE